MQFKVPQDVQRADKIVGPLTLKHMIILGAGGGLAYVIYIILARTYYWEVWFPPVAFVVLLTLLVAFLKIYNVTFGKFLILLFEFLLIPRTRKWAKSTAEIIKIDYMTQKQTVKDKKKTPKRKNTAEDMKKLQDITKNLDKYSKKLKSIK